MSNLRVNTTQLLVAVMVATAAMGLILWMIAANRNSTFAPATIATADGVAWREESAPWPPVAPRD